MEADSGHEASWRWPAFPDLAGHFHRLFSFISWEGSRLNHFRLSERCTTPVVWCGSRRLFVLKGSLWMHWVLASSIHWPPLLGGAADWGNGLGLGLSAPTQGNMAGGVSKGTCT